MYMAARRGGVEGLRILEAQLDRMRGMLGAYSGLFFRQITIWGVVSLLLLALSGLSTGAPVAVLLLFVVPFAFLEAGYTFTKGDQTFTPKIIMKLTLVAFLVALLSTIAGISPGLIFNSFLLQLDMHPAVGSATGMYGSMFTTMAATINTLINKWNST